MGGGAFLRRFINLGALGGCFECLFGGRLACLFEGHSETEPAEKCLRQAARLKDRGQDFYKRP